MIHAACWDYFLTGLWSGSFLVAFPLVVFLAFYLLVKWPNNARS